MAVADIEPDLILLTEVIPKAQTNPLSVATLSIPGYTMYLNFCPDHSNLGKGGCRGICIFVSSSLQATEVCFPSCDFKEQLWIKIKLQGADQLLLGCIYRSPSADGHLSTKSLIDLLQTSSSSNFSHLVLAGDINMPQIEWTNSFSYAPDGHYTHSFIEALHECGLVQHVMNATRYRQGMRPSALDIILSNEAGLVQNLTYLPPLGNSDHVMLQFEVTCYTKRTDSDRVRLNFNKGDYGHLNKMIRETVWDVAEPSDIQQQYGIFRDTLSHLVASCIPPTCPRSKRRNIYINRDAMRLKRKKRRLWTAYIRSKDGISYSRYTRCKNDLRRLTRNLRKEFEMKLIANIKDNPRSFWNYASSRMKTKPGVENLRTVDGSLTSCDDEKAMVLNKFFSSVCTLEVEDHHPNPEAEIDYGGPILEDVDVTADLVRKKLTELRPSSAA